MAIKLTLLLSSGHRAAVTLIEGDPLLTSLREIASDPAAALVERYSSPRRSCCRSPSVRKTSGSSVRCIRSPSQASSKSFSRSCARELMIFFKLVRRVADFRYDRS